MVKNGEKVKGGGGERLIRQNILQNELIKKCLYFMSLNNRVRIGYVNIAAHMEERLSCFAATYTVRYGRDNLHCLVLVKFLSV